MLVPSYQRALTQIPWNNWYGVWGTGNATNASLSDKYWTNNVGGYTNSIKGCKGTPQYNSGAVSNITVIDCFYNVIPYMVNGGNTYTNYLEYCSPFAKYTGYAIPTGYLGAGSVNMTITNPVSRQCTNTSIIYGLNITRGYNNSNTTFYYNEQSYIVIPNGLIGVQNYPDENGPDRRGQWNSTDYVPTYCNVSNIMYLYNLTTSVPYLVDVGGKPPMEFNSSTVFPVGAWKTRYNPLYKDRSQDIYMLKYKA